MALILITGAMGTGKTALAIKLLLESEHYPGSVFVFGVRGWKGAGQYRELPGDNPVGNQEMLEQLGRISHTCYLVDEAKKVWPSRVAGRPAPPFIDSQLAESRSVSQDWILTAQAPGQIDVKVRHLVTRHIHLEKTAFGIRYSEAGSCRDDLKFDRDETRKYDFPVKSLELYTTDEGETVHQKKGLKLPRRLIFLLSVIFICFGMIYYFAGRSELFKSVVSQTTKPPEQVQQLSNVPTSTASIEEEIKPLSQAPNHFYYLPRNPEYPELARAPRLPVSCLKSASKGCVCFDQKGQRLEIVGDRCDAILENRNTLLTLYPDHSSNQENHPQYVQQQPVDQKLNTPMI